MIFSGDLFVCFGDRVQVSPGLPKTHYVAEIDLEFLIFLTLPPVCEDYGLTTQYISWFIQCAGDRTQSLVHASQTFYQQSHTSALINSCLKAQMCLSLPYVLMVDK